MDKYELSAQPRITLGRKVKKLRDQNLIPANIYGKNIASANIQVDAKEFAKIFAKIGESTLAFLSVKGERNQRPVFVTDTAKHPVTGKILHIVFHQVDLKEKVTANVPVKLAGESVAEKEKLGIMVQQLDELEVEALPTDMPEHIEVDVTVLDQVGAHIKVGDLKLDAKKLTVKTEPETIVVQIEELAKEEVVTPPPSEAEEVPAPGEEAQPETEETAAAPKPESPEE
jgi:large subunit ribosomal protein L25